MALTEKITSIADAIRSKTGTTDTMTLAQMPELINGIQTGGGGFPNGTEWTQSNIYNKSTSKGSFVEYADGIFVGGAVSGLYYSTDGMTWTQSNITESQSRASATYGNGMWVLAGLSSGVYYSTDGMNWIQSNIGTHSVYSSTDERAFYYGGMWVLGCRTGLHYSTDGMTWTQSNVTTSVNLSTVAYGNGVWVAGAGSGNRVLYYSVDGITWTQTDPTLVVIYVVYANGVFVSHTNSGMYYSTDGATWIEGVIDSGYSMSRLVNANGVWVGGSSTKGLYYSIDGKTWTQSNITTGDTQCVCCCGDRWYANGASSDSDVYSSVDGMTWEKLATTDMILANMFYANGVWCSYAMYSVDGVNWNRNPLKDSDFFSANKIIHARNVWVASNGSGDGFCYSLTWAPST